MNSDDLIRKELLALLRGGNAYMTFEEVIADFPLKLITIRPPHTPYSAWHFLEHMRIAQWDILEFIRNPDHVSPEYPQGYRPNASEIADEARWYDTIAGIRADCAALEGLVTDPSLDLFAPIPHAPDYSIFREILLVADHNAYHIGELAILRQVLDAWPPDSPYLTG